MNHGVLRSRYHAQVVLDGDVRGQERQRLQQVGHRRSAGHADGLAVHLQLDARIVGHGTYLAAARWAR